MPAPRGQKRKSDQMTASIDDHRALPETATHKVATKTGDDTQESPTKKRKIGLTLAQKQAMIDNLQMEITKRARTLRSKYNEYAHLLRFRIETRAQKIPSSLLGTKMGDLLAKRTAEQQQKTTVPPASSFRPPPVPPKDVIVGRPALQRTAQGNAFVASPVRVAKRSSEDISGGDKENEMAHIDNPKKKPRANPAGAATRPAPNPSQVLSPASSNSRVLPPRERAAAAPSPGRSFIARPVSPTKPAPSNSGMFSSMVEKARSTRAAATTRKTTTSSTASSASGSAATTRARKAAAAAAPASRAGATSRAARRVSAISESSDGSTGTVVRKRTTTAAAAPATTAKRTVMGTIRKGVTGTATKKAPAAKAAPAAASTGRVLRKRN
ncbi:hypothetical protein BR93DRAFT_929863 [Coniochaeta sp. PMI_546]|nr:hypothetical protein BR93DRAFT_929863 [Coniochaeta sp. PMI_546]